MLIFWRGRGILIPIFGVIGAVIGLVASVAVNVFGFHGKIAYLEAWAGIAGTVLSLWLCSRTVCRTQYQRTVDPYTRRPVLLTNHHTFYFMTASSWLVIIALVGTTSIGVSLYRDSYSPSRLASPEVRQKAEELSNKITQALNGHNHATSSGNNAKATQLAAEFHPAFLEAVGHLLNVPAKDRAKTLSAIGLRTYCVLTPAQCAVFIDADNTKPLGTGHNQALSTTAWTQLIPVVENLSPVPAKVSIVIAGMFPDISIRRINGTSDSADKRQSAPAYDDLLTELAQEEAFRSKAASTAEEARSVSSTSSSKTSESAPAEKLSLPTGLRIWTDSGGHLIRASLLEFASNTQESAIFEMENGERREVPLEQLSGGDQKLIRSLAAKP